MDTSRILIAVILSIGLVFAYQELVLKRMYPPPSQQAGAQPTPGSIGASPSSAPSFAAASPAAPSTAVTAATGAGALEGAKGAVAAERLIEVDSDLFRATFTTRGARLAGFALKNYRQTSAANSPWYELVQPSKEGRLPLGLVIKTDSTMADDHELDYTVDAPAKVTISGADQSTLSFKAHASDGLEITKTFTLSGDKYTFAMSAAASAPKPPEAIGVSYTEPIGQREGYYDITELQADVQNKVITAAEKALRKGVEPASGTITYAGFGDRYFLGAFLPVAPTTGTLQMEIFGQEASARLLFAGASSLKTDVYMGPKELKILESVNPSLNKAIDFGWAGFIALPLLRALKLFNRVVPNWGWDIILLTILIRILTLPMSIKAQRSMLKMQRLQPQVERLRAQFKDDPDKLNREMMDLYKRNHVSPLGGCAPTAIQLPVFIGLYEALLNAVDLRHSGFIFWIKDLSAPDCLPVSWIPQLPFMHCQGIPVLVLLMGLSTYVQQWMSPTSPDPNQQKMMMLTPIIFTVMLVNFPAGLSLYYFSSNVLGVIQQFVLNREFKNAPVS